MLYNFLNDKKAPQIGEPGIFPFWLCNSSNLELFDALYQRHDLVAARTLCVTWNDVHIYIIFLIINYKFKILLLEDRLQIHLQAKYCR